MRSGSGPAQFIVDAERPVLRNSVPRSTAKTQKRALTIGL
jgi:hypothetical protein